MPTEITENVFDITCQTLDSGKRYRAFYDVADEPTLFDAGLAESVDGLFEGIEAIDVEPERLVVTHGDPDHVGGLDAVVDRYGVETWVPEQYDGRNASREPDNRYGDGDRIGRFTAVHLPGHEPDNHGFVDEAAGVAVLGDALSGADQRGLPAGYFHLPPAVYSRDLNQAEESLERLLEYSFDVGLVYHGSSVTADASEKIDRYLNFPGKP